MHGTIGSTTAMIQIIAVGRLSAYIFSSLNQYENPLKKEDDILWEEMQEKEVYK